MSGEADCMNMQTIHHTAWDSRAVTLVCGPPGSGKSTLARQLHASVLELEDITGSTHEQRLKMFGRRAHRIGRLPVADHAVVRCAASVAEREHHERLCRPARTVVLLTPPDVCHERITARGRPTADGEHDEVDRWWSVWNEEHA